MENKPLKIDKHNLIFNITSNGLEFHCYVPQPNMIEVKSLSRVLAYFFNAFTNKDNPLVMVIDYERYIEEALEAVNNEEQRKRKIEQVDTFLERSLLGATIYDNEWAEYDKNKFSDDDKAMFNGMLLFTCALYRYSTMQGRASYKEELYTSLSAMEWREHSKKRLQKSTQKQARKEAIPEQKTQEEENPEEKTLFVSVN